MSIMSPITADLPSIYAEFLPNIRQVSIAVSLPSPADPATTLAQISADGSKFQIRHGSSTKEVSLPAPVSAPSVLHVSQGQQADTTSLVWRLPASASALASSVRLDPMPDVPWDAYNLVAQSAVSCRTCHQTLISAGRIREWRNLPSENWAEMMEFWHCHKPHDHSHGHGECNAHENESAGTQKSAGGRKQDDDHLANRGYGANSYATARPGIGFVDITSLVLAEEDCTGLGVSYLYPPTPSYPKHSIRGASSWSYKKAARPGMFVVPIPHGLVTDTQLRD